MAPVSIRLGTNLWIVWLEIAAERTNAAQAERTRNPSVPIGPQYTTVTDNELRAGMVAVSAAAHALDAFYGSVDQHVTLPAGTRAAWSRNRTKRIARIQETLKIAFDLGAHGRSWQTDFVWLFDLRDAAVHHVSQAREPVPHPDGRTSVAHETATYTVEAAERATRFAREVMVVCMSSPRGSQPKVKEWVESMPHVPNHLRGVAP